MSEQHQEFWLVWSPTGAKSPSFRHPSEHSAITEAERLARTAPGQQFYVLHATNLRYVDDMTRIVLLHRDEIPF